MTWKAVVPDQPFDYSFLENTFDKELRIIEDVFVGLKYFSMLTAIIACLGLYGLVCFSAEQRTKEIGIRKVYGASVRRIMMMQCKSFAGLILLANAIAFPLVYLTMIAILANLPYPIKISWDYFVSTAILSFVLALLAVGYRAYRAATANPVDSLRYE